ncbi:MAG: hypothetical protein ACRC8W_12525 [Plesiomonas shigelloides]
MEIDVRDYSRSGSGLTLDKVDNGEDMTIVRYKRRKSPTYSYSLKAIDYHAEHEEQAVPSSQFKPNICKLLDKLVDVGDSMFIRRHVSSQYLPRIYQVTLVSIGGK